MRFTGNELKQIDDITFTKLILQERLSKCGNSKTPMVLKLNQAINTMNELSNNYNLRPYIESTKGFTF